MTGPTPTPTRSCCGWRTWTPICGLPRVALEVTRAAIDADAANSYLPFEGQRALLAGGGRARQRDERAVATTPPRQCVSVAGGLNGILNMLLATVEPGQEVVICDPIYAGLVNRIRLAGAVPRHVRCGPARAAGPPTRMSWPGHRTGTAAVLLMSPAMPTGAVLGPEHYDAIAGPVRRHGAWVIYDAAMERIRFDGSGRSIRPPTPGVCADHTVAPRRRNCG